MVMREHDTKAETLAVESQCPRQVSSHTVKSRLRRRLPNARRVTIAGVLMVILVASGVLAFFIAHWIAP
jgi:hypothetical protein